VSNVLVLSPLFTKKGRASINPRKSSSFTN
jgi:hypothetical protein